MHDRAVPDEFSKVTWREFMSRPCLQISDGSQYLLLTSTFPQVRLCLGAGDVAIVMDLFLKCATGAVKRAGVSSHNYKVHRKVQYDAVRQ